MNIDVNGRFLCRRMTGVDRFAFESLLAIDELIGCNDPIVDGVSFRILVPQKTPVESRLRHISVEVVGNARGQVWEQAELPRYVSPNGMLLNLCNTGPAFFRRQVVVIHDAATARMPSTFGWGFRTWYRLLMPLIGASAKRVLTVSEFSKREVSEAFGIEAGLIEVVGEGGEHILRASADQTALARFGLSRPFVLCVGSMAPHKNFGLVVKAFSQLGEPGFDLAIAGGANARVFAGGEVGNTEHVRWLGYVSEEELKALYESAMCFVFPSLYEGFGIPPLEAMNCGCPVLTANAASMPEVCGEAALYFDPADAGELARLLMKVSEEADVREKLIERGKGRAAMFSWDITARQLIAACKAGDEK